MGCCQSASNEVIRPQSTKNKPGNQEQQAIQQSVQQQQITSIELLQQMPEEIRKEQKEEHMDPNLENVLQQENLAIEQQQTSNCKLMLNEASYKEDETEEYRWRLAENHNYRITNEVIQTLRKLGKQNRIKGENLNEQQLVLVDQLIEKIYDKKLTVEEIQAAAIELNVTINELVFFQDKVGNIILDILLIQDLYAIFVQLLQIIEIKQNQQIEAISLLLIKKIIALLRNDKNTTLSFSIIDKLRDIPNVKIILCAFNLLQTLDCSEPEELSERKHIFNISSHLNLAKPTHIKFLGRVVKLFASHGVQTTLFSLYQSAKQNQYFTNLQLPKRGAYLTSEQNVNKLNDLLILKHLDITIFHQFAFMKKWEIFINQFHSEYFLGNRLGMTPYLLIMQYAPLEVINKFHRAHKQNFTLEAFNSKSNQGKNILHYFALNKYNSHENVCEFIEEISSWPNYASLCSQAYMGQTPLVLYLDAVKSCNLKVIHFLSLPLVKTVNIVKLNYNAVLFSQLHKLKQVIGPKKWRTLEVTIDNQSILVHQAISECLNELEEEFTNNYLNNIQVAKILIKRKFDIQLDWIQWESYSSYIPYDYSGQTTSLIQLLVRNDFIDLAMKQISNLDISIQYAQNYKLSNINIEITKQFLLNIQMQKEFQSNQSSNILEVSQVCQNISQLCSCYQETQGNQQLLKKCLISKFNCILEQQPHLLLYPIHGNCKPHGRIFNTLLNQIIEQQNNMEIMQQNICPINVKSKLDKYCINNFLLNCINNRSFLPQSDNPQFYRAMFEQCQLMAVFNVSESGMLQIHLCKDQAQLEENEIGVTLEQLLKLITNSKQIWTLVQKYFQSGEFFQEKSVVRLDNNILEVLIENIEILRNWDSCALHKQIYHTLWNHEFKNELRIIKQLQKLEEPIHISPYTESDLIRIFNWQMDDVQIQSTFLFIESEDYRARAIIKQSQGQQFINILCSDDAFNSCLQQYFKDFLKNYEVSVEQKSEYIAVALVNAPENAKFILQIVLENINGEKQQYYVISKIIQTIGLNRNQKTLKDHNQQNVISKQIQIFRTSIYRYLSTIVYTFKNGNLNMTDFYCAQQNEQFDVGNLLKLTNKLLIEQLMSKCPFVTDQTYFTIYQFALLNGFYETINDILTRIYCIRNFELLEENGSSNQIGIVTQQINQLVDKVKTINQNLQGIQIYFNTIELLAEMVTPILSSAQSNHLYFEISQVIEQISNWNYFHEIITSIIMNNINGIKKFKCVCGVVIGFKQSQSYDNYSSQFRDSKLDCILAFSETGYLMQGNLLSVQMNVVRLSAIDNDKKQIQTQKHFNKSISNVVNSHDFFLSLLPFEEVMIHCRQLIDKELLQISNRFSEHRNQRITIAVVEESIKLLFLHPLQKQGQTEKMQIASIRYKLAQNLYQQISINLYDLLSSILDESIEVYQKLEIVLTKGMEIIDHQQHQLFSSSVGNYTSQAIGFEVNKQILASLIQVGQIYTVTYIVKQEQFSETVQFIGNPSSLLYRFKRMTGINSVLDELQLKNQQPLLSTSENLNLEYFQITYDQIESFYIYSTVWPALDLIQNNLLKVIYKNIDNNLCICTDGAMIKSISRTLWYNPNSTHLAQIQQVCQSQSMLLDNGIGPRFACAVECTSKEVKFNNSSSTLINFHIYSGFILSIYYDILGYHYCIVRYKPQTKTQSHISKQKVQSKQRQVQIE